MSSEQKIISYRTVLGNQPAKLDTDVEKRLQEGWELYGYPYTDGDFHYQAMVKREEPKKVRVGAMLA